MLAPGPTYASGFEPIPGYRLVEFLGRGGFGEVWKCIAPGGLCKAIKFVSGSLTGVQSDSSQARQELDALERVKAIRHPFILSLDRVEVVNGQLVVVMELADRSLQDRFEECQAAGERGIPRDELLGYMLEAAEALDVMNLRHGLLHLDIKPGNLFLFANHVKVADFGLVNRVGAGNSEEGSLGGITPLYSAPETFLGKLSPQSDQYSLAIVYQHLLTGKTPFEGKNVRQLALQHVNQPPRLDSLSESDHPLVARALAKNPGERHPSCLEFVHGLMLAERDPVKGKAAVRSRPNTSRVLRLATKDSAGRPRSRGIRGSTWSSRSSQETPTAVPRTAETLPDQAVPSATCPVLPGYRFLGLQAQTPFGDVWTVQAPGGRTRRLRFLPDLPGWDPDEERSTLERLCALTHPALLATELLVTESGRRLLVTDLFEQTLADRSRIYQTRRLPGIPRSELLGYLWTAADLLDHLHTEEGVHHLALTPASLVFMGEQLLVADLGLVELFGGTEYLRASLAARYAAPELLEGQVVPGCDQYSLALIYCEMLTGVHPYRGQSLQRMAKERHRLRPALDLIAAADRQSITRALHVDPDQRFDSCGALVQALESGECMPSLSSPSASSREAKARSESQEPFAPTPLPCPLFATDPNIAVDRLHRLLGTLGKGASGRTFSAGESGDLGPHLECRCGARVYGPTVKIKLDGFRQQWGAEVANKGQGAIVYRIPLSQSFWRRCLGREQPSLEVAIQFQQPQTLTAELTEVLLVARPVHCDKAESTRLLNETAPLVLDSARSYLQAAPERRGQERLIFQDRVPVVPVFAGQSFGPILECTGKDVSPRGIGLLAGGEPPSKQILVGLPGRSGEEPIFLPAEVVRMHRRTDGRCEIGARFAFGGFGQPIR